MRDVATSDLSSSISLLGRVGQMQGKITCFLMKVARDFSLLRIMRPPLQLSTCL